MIVSFVPSLRSRALVLLSIERKLPITLHVSRSFPLVSFSPSSVFCDRSITILFQNVLKTVTFRVDFVRNFLRTRLEGSVFVRWKNRYVWFFHGIDGNPRLPRKKKKKERKQVTNVANLIGYPFINFLYVLHLADFREDVEQTYVPSTIIQIYRSVVPNPFFFLALPHYLCVT